MPVCNLVETGNINALGIAKSDQLALAELCVHLVQNLPKLLRVTLFEKEKVVLVPIFFSNRGDILEFHDAVELPPLEKRVFKRTVIIEGENNALPVIPSATHPRFSVNMFACVLFNPNPL